MTKQTLADRVKESLERLRTESAEIRDQEWAEREQAGENLILILRGEHWESTRPSERTVEQKREALFHGIKKNRREQQNGK